MSIEIRIRSRRGDFQLETDLEIPASGVTVVFGPSGSGKTSLLRCVAGLDRPDEGTIRVNGVTWHSPSRFLPPHRRSIGYVMQQAGLFPHLDVRGNLEYGFRRICGVARRVSLEEAIGLVRLEPLLTRRIDSLSGGERQRVSIARSLASSPALLLFDEPLSAVDAAHREEILSLLEELFRKLDLPVVYVTHDWREVLRVADHLVFLDAGKVVQSGSLPDLLAAGNLPLATRDGGASMVPATVAEIDESYGLARLAFPGGEWVASSSGLRAGDFVRVIIEAEDVSLARSAAPDSSILNIVGAEVESIEEFAPSRVRVRLRVGSARIAAHITRKSCDNLGLKRGLAVFAQVKSVALFR